tara:strand:- start:509 stop:1012 length:504 start_codon:yes stop_codon:yes gene_type:complete
MKLLFENWRKFLNEGYVINKANPITIKEIIANWVEGERAFDDGEFHIMATIDDVLEYRDFSSEPNKLSQKEFQGLQKDLKEVGVMNPIVMEVGKNGQASITSGNQIIELAKQLNIKELPVSFVFKDEVQKAGKVTAEPATLKKAVEDQEEQGVYMQSMQSGGSSSDI